MKLPTTANFRRLLPLAFALIVATSQLAAAQDWESLKQRFKDRPLLWGGDAEGGAPFQLRDPDDPNRVIGFEVELADAIAESLGRLWSQPVRAEFKQYEWVSLPLGLDKQDFDIILSGYEITPENEEKVLFSRPYYVYTQQLVVRADEQRIASLADCGTMTVATLAGSAAERLLEQSGVTDIVAFDGNVEAYLDLELGRVDAALMDTPIAIFYAQSNDKLKFVGPQVGEGYYGIAMRHDDRELKQALDAAIGDLIVSGRLREIYRRWHLWNDAQIGLALRSERELAGLKFDALGRPLSSDEPAPADAVDIKIIASSAEKWTFDRYAPLLIGAAGMTVFLTVVSMTVAMAIGLLVSLCRLYAPGPVRGLALVYVEFFRGVPLLLLLFFLYFGLPTFGVELSAISTAIVGFGLNYAAYEAEIYRSSIQAVPVGQWEAGRALGMSEALTFRRVIFPQAFRTALGPMTNDAVALFKDTSLVSVIAVRELTKEYLILSRSSQKFVELGLLTAALYLMMSVPLGYLSRYLERRWGPGRAT